MSSFATRRGRGGESRDWSGLVEKLTTLSSRSGRDLPQPSATDGGGTHKSGRTKTSTRIAGRQGHPRSARKAYKKLSRTTSRPPGVMSQLPAATFPRRAYPTSPALQDSMASAIRRAPTRIHSDTPVTKTKEDDLSYSPSSETTQEFNSKNK